MCILGLEVRVPCVGVFVCARTRARAHTTPRYLHPQNTMLSHGCCEQLSPFRAHPKVSQGDLECLVLYYFYSPSLVLGNSKCCICIVSFNLHNNLSSEYLRNPPQAAWGEGKAEVQTQVYLLLPVPLHIFSITNR